MVNVKLENKKCTKCGEIKPLNEFYRNKASKDGYRSDCKDCCAARKKKWKENNRDKVLAEKRRYRERHKDKINARIREYRTENKEYVNELKRKAYEENRERYLELQRIRKRRYKARKRSNGGSYTSDELDDCLHYFNYRCAYTGEPLGDDYHMDHVVPVSKGGSSNIWNMVPSLPHVNISKLDRDMTEWYKEQDYYSDDRLLKILAWVTVGESDIVA